MSGWVKCEICEYIIKKQTVTGILGLLLKVKRKNANLSHTSHQKPMSIISKYLENRLPDISMIVLQTGLPWNPMVE